MRNAFVLCCSIALMGVIGTANAQEKTQDKPQDWTKSKWGPQDEIGAANYITPELVVKAASLVKTGKTYPLGMIIDSISIMLLTAAIFSPIAIQLGFDPIAFAIIAIIAIEAGLLTPPFGLLVYTVKSAIQDIDPTMNVMTIFKSSIPYWIIMLIAMALIVRFPEIATVLPNALFP